MNLSAWLAAMVQPLLARILTAIGFSVVSVVGMNAMLNQLRQYFVTSVNSLPADVLNLFLIAGGGTAAGILFGAIAVRVALWQIQNSTKILGTNPQ